MLIHPYRDIREIPKPLLGTLTQDLTLGAEGLMRGNALSMVSKITPPLGKWPAIVALDNPSTPIGWMFLDVRRGVEMFVAPQHRGKGVATQMMVSLMDTFGLSKGSIWVYNEQAERVLEKAAKAVEKISSANSQVSSFSGRRTKS